MSGCLLITPIAEQGTSAKILLNLEFINSSLSRLATSAQIILASTPILEKFSFIFIILLESLSTQVKLMLETDSRIWALFPPGAAQQSRTRSLDFKSNKLAANCAAASWTEQKPSLNKGSSETLTAFWIKVV